MLSMGIEFVSAYPRNYIKRSICITFFDQMKGQIITIWQEWKEGSYFFAKTCIVTKYYEAFCKKASKLKWIEKIVKIESDIIKTELQNDACK
jgi:hypothetical protein